jgi:hypothetical protein
MKTVQIDAVTKMVIGTVEPPVTTPAPNDRYFLTVDEKSETVAVGEFHNAAQSKFQKAAP